MDSSRFDALARSVDVHVTRRLLGRIAGVGTLSSLALLEFQEPVAEARKRRVRGEHNIRGNKAIMCINGETRRVPKKKRNKWLKRGASRGKCPGGCTPVCTGCGGPDGCGGTCPGCAAGSICVAGTCRACTLTCNDTSEACGEALRTDLDLGGTVVLCPGLYEGTFLPSQSAEVYGAGGDTDDPAVSTILTATEGSRVMSITAGITLLLSGVRVTGGEHPIEGGGISVNHNQAELTIENSVITENVASGQGGFGGGIANIAGSVTITNSEISFNSAWANGGGIYNAGSATTTLASTVSITENAADVGGGGGSGGGIYRDGGTVNLNGASVTLNTPDQCDGGVPGCP